MSPPTVLPPRIMRGLDGLRTIGACVIERAPTFDEQAKRWVVRLTLRRDHGAEFVGANSRWCLLVDSNYPFGGVSLYPAAEGGITATFPHQSRNTPSGDRRGWRGGKLCLDTPFAGERHAGTSDPVGDADGRLRWHVERARDWLQRAATNELLAAGDPFELPERPHTTVREWNLRRVVHDETATSLAGWVGRERSFGLVQFGALEDVRGVLSVRSFEDQHGTTIRTWNGRELGDGDTRANGFWWLWPEPIVLPPWYAPGTWGELRRIAKAQVVDVDGMLRWLFPRIRGSGTSTVLLLGYPIPMRVGAGATEVHWDAVILPRFADTAGKPPKGFRPNALGWWRRDRFEKLGDRVPLEYLFTENWSSDRLQARGRLSSSLRELRVVVLGVGALGSTLAEMLVRAGVRDIALVDEDFVEAGNVCRHVATLADVGRPKVKAVARRLCQISPTVRVVEVVEKLRGAPSDVVEQLDEYDVIVDCTASDDALNLLGTAWWPIPRLFTSFSMGYGGKRLFSYAVSGHQFPQEHFARRVRPWIEHETMRSSESEEILEGAGCWSPLFPARHDDVLLAAATCVKELETLVIKRPSLPRLRVFVQESGEDGFQGFRPEAAPPATEGTAS